MNSQSFSSRTYGYLYILVDDSGNVKVGGTENVQRRIWELSRRFGKLKLIVEVKAKYFMYFEKFIHIHLKSKGLNLTGEWYKDEGKVVCEVIDYIKKHSEVFGVYYARFPKSKKISKTESEGA